MVVGNALVSEAPRQSVCRAAENGLGNGRLFRVVFTYDGPGASDVRLVGDFNYWNPDLGTMSRSKEGWSATVELEPGTYQYKLVVDGEWVLDPVNLTRVDNGNGALNSVMTLTPAGEVIWGQASASGVGYYHQFESVKSPEWLEDAVIYSVFPRVITPDGSFQALIKRLPYVCSLGATCIWLLPIHEIGVADRKGNLGSPYAIRDYYSINRELGTEDDFRQLVATAHSMGLRVIMDLVINHTANDSPLVTEHPDWYRRDLSGRIVPPNPDWTDVSQLDHRNPELRDYLVGVASYWVREFDIDGYRCDVAGCVPEMLWRRIRKEIKSIKEDSILLAESSLPSHHLSSFDLTYDMGLIGTLQYAAASPRPGRILREYIREQRSLFPKRSLRLRYLENHDTYRAARVLPGPEYFSAAVLYSALDGVPLIYNGQETGETERPSLFDPVKIDLDSGTGRYRRLYTLLMQARHRIEALRRGDYIDVTTSDDERVFAFARVGGDSRAVVAVNLSGIGGDVVLRLDRHALGICSETVVRIKDILSGDDAVVSSEDLSSLRVSMRPYGAYLLVIDARS